MADQISYLTSGLTGPERAEVRNRSMNMLLSAMTPRACGRYAIDGQFCFVHSRSLCLTDLRSMQRAFLLCLFVTGTASQICCSGTMSTSKGKFPAVGTDSVCSSLDSGYTWTKATCNATATCQNYVCKITALGATLDSISYQGCYDSTTYQAAMKASSVNSYSCTSTGALSAVSNVIFVALVSVTTLMGAMGS